MLAEQVATLTSQHKAFEAKVRPEQLRGAFKEFQVSVSLHGLTYVPENTPHFIWRNAGSCSPY